MATYKAAFVTDLGKVIIDYDWGIMFQRLEELTGQSVADSERKFLGPVQQALSVRFCRGQIDSKQFYKECCLALGIECQYLSFEKFVECFNGIFLGGISGVIELLFLIRRRFDLTIMVTNTNELHFPLAKRIVSKAFEYFDHVIASHEVNLHKPDTKIYNLAIQYMESRGVRRENSLFVDDLQRNFDGAIAAGIGHTFLFYPGKEIELKKYLRERW